jgi:hypothetical protein
MVSFQTQETEKHSSHRPATKATITTTAGEVEGPDSVPAASSHPSDGTADLKAEPPRDGDGDGDEVTIFRAKSLARNQ